MCKQKLRLSLLSRVVACFLLVAFLQVSLSAEVSYIITNSKLQSFLAELQMLKNELQVSRSNFALLSQKAVELTKRGEALQKSLTLTSEESIALSNELTALQKDFEDYRKAMEAKIAQLETEKILFGVGGTLAGSGITLLILALAGAFK